MEAPSERTVPLREANQAFARFVREVEGGAAFTITRNGAPVARLVPIEKAARKLTPEQQAARERTRERMNRGLFPGVAPVDRDSLYER